ncbi:MAG TPA: NADH dehydrogenase (quinone) subunit D [Candidatus Deferrimicrobiaceae bacterium]|nr:NADH dehydrogenase (quinone) subunit D [Candidatus Deferrimicrobiaceae bacterium]
MTQIETYRREAGTLDMQAEPMILNIGPSHPATHATLRLIAELDGETILKLTPEFGYLHRCFEKESENATWTQVIPYTDRLNYVSSLMNNVGYVMAVEKLFGIEVTERCKYIRVLICELSRIIDHMVCIGANMVDIGALTNFWYFWKPREEVYMHLIEPLTGIRLTTQYTRIGGLQWDLPDGWVEKCRDICRDVIVPAIADVNALLTKNRIFIERTMGVGSITPKEAIARGFTGPCLRAAGVPLDLRKDETYLVYDRFDFDVPIGEQGDTCDRYMVRMEEMRQSLRIIEQALDQLPGGPVNVDDPRFLLPPKQEVYGNIEALMNHFKHIMDGIRVPAGEVYSATEAANGELGYYIVSKGGGGPYKIKVRPPCFPLFQGMPHLCEGGMLADLIAVLGSVNIIAGELDR